MKRHCSVYVNPEGASTDLLHGATGDSRISDILVDILKGKSTANHIKTGWGEFDTKTGGFSRGDLVVLTANYGGGKSAAPHDVPQHAQLQLHNCDGEYGT